MNANRLLFVVVAAMFLPKSLCAQYKCQGIPMWERRDPHHVSLFRDTSARLVGDLLTVIIQESTDVGNRDQRAMGKSSDASYDFNVASAGTSGGASGNFDIGNNSSRNYGGNSSYTVERDFSDRMTVRVTRVLPNGNLLIAGRRQQLVTGEMRTLCLKGVVRAMDISAANTVRSQYVADLEMCYEGDGPDSHFTNQNWGGRIFNKIWPF